MFAGCGGQRAESAPAADPVAAGEIDPAPDAEHEPGVDPCRATSFEFSEVESACSQGGVKAAKDLMKGYVKRAREQGKKLKCSSCHDDTQAFTLSDNAVADLRAVLED